MVSTLKGSAKIRARTKAKVAFKVGVGAMEDINRAAGTITEAVTVVGASEVRDGTEISATRNLQMDISQDLDNV